MVSSFMEIRSETSADHEDIYALTKLAFDPMPFSDGTEADCITKLRADGDLKISLVAVENSCVIGHVAFSPVFISETPKGWFGLGPVSVWPDRQKTGIGSKLITAGLDILKDQHAIGCVLIGDPNYYSRFGFVSDGYLSYRDLPEAYVQWVGFSDVPAKGRLTLSFHALEETLRL